MNQLKKTFPTLLLMLSLLLSFGLTRSVLSQSQGTVLFVEPSQVSGTTCGEATFAIRVSDVENLTGYHLEILFDPAIIEVTDVANGGFLDGDVDQAFYEQTNTIDNTQGKIIFGMVQQNSIDDPMTPKSGEGDLIHVTFNSRVPNASTNITIDDENSLLVDWPDAFTVDYSAVNGSVNTSSCPPTDLDITKFELPENEPIGTLVGRFATTDPDTGDSFTYTLVDTSAYPDNTAFEILGEDLFSQRIFNYEQKNTYEIRVRSTDFGGLWIEKVFQIDILDVNDRPVAYDQTVITPESQPVRITLTGYDEDGTDLLFTVVEQPKFGTLTGTAPNLIYTPDHRYEGLDHLRFTASDGELTSEPATVDITMESKYVADYWFPLFSFQD